MEPGQATLARWLKEDRARVMAGEAICELETDKACMDVAAWADGVLHHLAREGDAISDRAPIARID